jgi:hypothetical protein
MQAEAAALFRLEEGALEPDAVTNLVPAFRVGDTVTVLLNGATRSPDHTDLAELTAAAAPLLDAIERLGLTPRKERR